MGGDVIDLEEYKRDYISIHAPRVGGDDSSPSTCKRTLQFQSTPPVWGATLGVVGGSRGNIISIHAPRVGGDSFGDG